MEYFSRTTVRLQESSLAVYVHARENSYDYFALLKDRCGRKGEGGGGAKRQRRSSCVVRGVDDEYDSAGQKRCVTLPVVLHAFHALLSVMLCTVDGVRSNIVAVMGLICQQIGRARSLLASAIRGLALFATVQ